MNLFKIIYYLYAPISISPSKGENPLKYYLPYRMLQKFVFFFHFSFFIIFVFFAHNQASSVLSTVTFIQSARGKRQIIHHGYKYSFWPRYEGKQVVRWYCSSHHARGCKAALKTVDDIIIYSSNHHNHDPPFR